MDPKELRGLMEAYSEVYAPQEEIEEASYSAKAARAGKDIGKPGKMFAKIAKSAAKRYGSEERGKKVAGAVLAKLRSEEIEVFEDMLDEAVKGASRHDTEMRKAAASERRSGIKPLPAKEGEKYAKYKMAQMDYAKRKRMGEEVSVFDVVLEFLQAEGYAETLEEAEWLMANVIDEEAIEIILDEGHGSRTSFKKQSKDERWRVKTFGSNYTPHKNYDPEANRGQGQILRPNQAEKQRRKKLAKSAMGEEYMDEAQAARENPEKYEAGEKKKYAPVRGERTPMPPRGDKRREDFEKWYAANVR